MNIDSIRTAAKSDVKAITQLVNKAYRPELGAHGWTHESALVSGDRTNVGQVMEAILKKGSAILLGFKDSDIVACVHIEKDGNSCHIGMLAVQPNLQAAGIGKAMLAQAEYYASVNFGAKKIIMLVVSARTELISFYLRRGYRKTGEVMDYPWSGAGMPKCRGLNVERLGKNLGEA